MRKILLICLTLLLVFGLAAGLVFADREGKEDKKSGKEEAAEEVKEVKKMKVREMTLYHDNPEFQEFWTNMGIFYRY